MPIRPPLVLVVNDDEAVRNALQFRLEIENVEVHSYAEGSNLLADPDLPRARCLILKDRLQPMDVFEILDHLSARNISLPAIILTNAATGKLYEQAKAAGVRMVLEKPILDNTLIDGVLSILVQEAADASRTT